MNVARQLVERTRRFMANCAVAVRKAVRDSLKQLAQDVRYLRLFLSSILSNVLLLVLAVVPAILPILIVWGLYEHWEAFVRCIHRIGQNTPIVQALAFIIVGAGVLGGIVMKIAEAAYEDLCEFGKALVEVLCEGWRRGSTLEEEQPLGPWRDNIDEIPGTVWKALKRASRFALALLGGVFLIATAYPLFARPVQPVQTVDRYVAVVDTKDTNAETRQEIKLYMSTGAVFSLAYVDDAQPRDGKGICLDEPQQEWLREFRAAISNCMEEESETTGEGSGTDDVRFKVTGYASIAPMHVDPDMSAKQNCKVANWRAAAVGAFLANPDAEELKKRWSCEHMGDDFNRGPYECGELTKDPYEGMDAQGNPFLVDVHQWSTPDRMAEGRPADDGEPNRRRFDVEILNRVVHIKVPLGFCGEAPQETTTP